MTLLIPMTILIVLTMLSLVLMVVSRINAVKAGSVKAGYFKIFQNRSENQIPEKVIRIGRHYQNLVELPIIFYIVCLVAIQFDQAESVQIWAWIFVAARVIQSFIHLTSNHVLFRMLSFALGCFALIGMWFTLIGKVFL